MTAIAAKFCGGLLGAGQWSEHAVIFLHEALVTETHYTLC
jgi:hypothetical protein